MRPLLHLVAILKNEAGNIRATLESVKPWVDGWTVLDTQSTDGTQAIVQEVMAGLPGQLVQEAFVDYATTRNRALEIDAAREPIFTLFLGGDEVLHEGARLRAFLEMKREAAEGAYCVRMESSGRSWAYTRVLRTDAQWRYLGEIHERPVGPKGQVHGPIIPGVTVVHSASDPERKKKRLLEYDLPLLTKDVQDESKSWEERAHSLFFLAETYYILASMCDRKIPWGPWATNMMTAMSCYLRYAKLAGRSNSAAMDISKAAYSYFLYFHIADELNIYQSMEMVPRLTSLVQEAPHLLEAKFLLAKHTAQLPNANAARDGMRLAVIAADAAKEARGKPSYETSDLRVEWMSMKVAAACAKHMKIPERAKSYAERGLAAGGPRAAFAEYLGEKFSDHLGKSL